MAQEAALALPAVADAEDVATAVRDALVTRVAVAVALLVETAEATAAFLCVASAVALDEAAIVHVASTTNAVP